MNHAAFLRNLVPNRAHIAKTKTTYHCVTPFF
jgi:hypothetical protein